MHEHSYAVALAHVNVESERFDALAAGRPRRRPPTALLRKEAPSSRRGPSHTARRMEIGKASQ